MKEFRGLSCGAQNRPSNESHGYFSVGYENCIKEFVGSTWYDVLPYSTALWPHGYAESTRSGAWWMHRENYISLCIEYVVSGYAEYHFNGKTEVLGKGDVWVTLPGDVVTLSDHNRQKLHRIQVVIGGGLTKLAPETLGLQKQHCFHVNSIYGKEKFYRILSELKETIEMRNPAEASRNSLLGYELLLFLSECCKNPSCTTDDLPDVITNTLNRMLAVSNEGYSVSQLAKFANVSRMTLTRLFKRHLNTTPLAYWMNLKIEHAKQMLINSNKTIKEISNELGFSNQLYFSTLFHRRCGMSPTAYRKANTPQALQKGLND